MTQKEGTSLNNSSDTSQNGVEKRPVLPLQIGTDFTFKRKIVWFNAIGFLILHILGLYGYIMLLRGQVYLLTFIWAFFIGQLSGEGISFGAHRLWAHKTYKAKLPLRLGLLLLYTLAGQNCLWIWVRDHRQHHKYSDTDADPHNAKRGFFFSHIGWLMTKKHPLVIEYGKNIDMSDLEADEWVMFQKRYYKTLYILISIIIPMYIPVYIWGEDPYISFVVSYISRAVTVLNLTWSINSFAHLYGNRPYDSKLQAAEAWGVSVVTNGEGWHNYHHAFPWDYRAAELGRDWNATTHLIDWFAKIGQIYDRKSASTNMVSARIKRTGDGTHPSEIGNISQKMPDGLIDSIDSAGYPLMPSEWNAGEKLSMYPKYENNIADTKLMMTVNNGTSLKNHTIENGVQKRPVLPSQIGTDLMFKSKVVWFNAIGFLVLHILALYGYVVMLTGQAHLLTCIWVYILVQLSAEGITIGAHRLWTHKSFKAKLPLRICLLVLQTLAGQNCLWVWVRDHRQHHKYSDTDADPHNAKRGFFFSHIGWLMTKKHPLVIEYGKNIDMSDLNADKWVMIQKRFYKTFYLIISVIIPTYIPVYLWGEDAYVSFILSYLTRTVTLFNITWSVNSFAHLYGNRPYDSKLQPVEAWSVSMVSNGEGWHNYHHAFPWDYRAAELGRDWNATAHIIDWFAKIGQVYDRRAAPMIMVTARIKRSGDGTHPSEINNLSEKTEGPRDSINLSSYPLPARELNAGEKSRLNPKYEEYTADTKAIERNLGSTDICIEELKKTNQRYGTHWMY